MFTLTAFHLFSLEDLSANQREDSVTHFALRIAKLHDDIELVTVFGVDMVTFESGCTPCRGVVVGLPLELGSFITPVGH